MPESHRTHLGHCRLQKPLTQILHCSEYCGPINPCCVSLSQTPTEADTCHAPSVTPSLWSLFSHRICRRWGITEQAARVKLPQIACYGKQPNDVNACEHGPEDVFLKLGSLPPQAARTRSHPLPAKAHPQAAKCNGGL